MRTFLVVLAIVACAIRVNAECPGSCSGHGTCGDKDACSCEPNWMGSDCSQRVCPFGLSFVDTPRGDLNHDGTIEPNSVADQYVHVQWSNVKEYEAFPSDSSVFKASLEEAHFYNECSGKGFCNRDAGECQCFPGYTGSACQRTTCANECSGHGICRTVGEIAARSYNKRRASSANGENLFSGVSSDFTYRLWDADKHQACVCDPGFTGYDCVKRECPRGNDPLTVGTRFQGNSGVATYTTVTFSLSSGGSTTLKVGFTDWTGRLQYVYPEVDTSSAAPGLIVGNDLPDASTVAGSIMDALRNMPGGAMNRVEVGSDTGVVGGTHVYTLTYKGLPGKQNVITLSVHTGNSIIAVAPAITVDGNEEEVTCSGRGICNYDAGLCQCFSGYYGQACDFQNALAFQSAASSGTISSKVSASTA